MANSVAYCLRRRIFPIPAGNLSRCVGRRTTGDTFSASFSTAACSSAPWLLVHDPVEERHSPSSKRYYYFRNLDGDTTIKKRDKRFDKVFDSDLPKNTGRYFGCSKEWVSRTVPPSTYNSKPCHPLFTNFGQSCIPLPGIDIDPLDYVMEPPCFPSTYGLEKLVISSSEPSDEDDARRLMVIRGRSRSLATCILGDIDVFTMHQPPDTWTMLQTEPYKNCDYRDIIYSNEEECFYAIRGEFSSPYWIEAWDVRDMNCPKRNLIRACLDHPYIGVEDFQTRMDYMTEKRYLVESAGDIYLVSRFLPRKFASIRSYETREEERERLVKESTWKITCVYKLDKKAEKWKYVESLGDRAFFIGTANHSFSRDTTDFPGVKINRNSIYYMDEDFHDGHIAGVYDLKTGVEKELFSNRHNPIVAPPVWIQSLPDSWF